VSILALSSRPSRVFFRRGQNLLITAEMMIYGLFFHYTFAYSDFESNGKLAEWYQMHVCVCVCTCLGACYVHEHMNKRSRVCVYHAYTTTHGRMHIRTNAHTRTHTCRHVHTYTHFHTHPHTHLCDHMRVFVCVCVCVCALVYGFLCLIARKHVRACLCTYVCIHMYLYVLNICLYP